MSCPRNRAARLQPRLRSVTRATISEWFRDSRVSTQWRERESQCQNSEVKCLEVTW